MIWGLSIMTGIASVQNNKTLLWSPSNIWSFMWKDRWFFSSQSTANRQVIVGNLTLLFSNIVRHYFAVATNPGEQFFTFTSLAAWLFTRCDRNFEQPQEVCNMEITGHCFLSDNECLIHPWCIIIEVVFFFSMMTLMLLCPAFWMNLKNWWDKFNNHLILIHKTDD